MTSAGSMWTPSLCLRVVILALAVLHDQAHALGTSFSYSMFDGDANHETVNTLGDTTYNRTNKAYSLQGLADWAKCVRRSGEETCNSCGRLLYKHPVRMKDAKGAASSFSTNFTIAFQSSNLTYCGDGMVFFFTPSNADTSGTERASYWNLAGGRMCAFDTKENQTDFRVFAVTFDSYRNDKYNPDFDVSDGNIAVILNKNKLNASNLCLGSANITNCNFFCGNKGDFSASIDYNSTDLKLRVQFWKGSIQDKSSSTMLTDLTASHVNLANAFLKNDMFVGFSGSTFGMGLNGPNDWQGKFYEQHYIKAWEFTGGFDTSEPKSQAGLIAGIVSAVGAGIGLFCLCVCVGMKRRKRYLCHRRLAQMTTPEFEGNPGAMTYSEVRMLTKNFSPSERISSGAFGDVYKGTLPSGKILAVKRIKEGNEQGEESFLAEATSLRQIRHRNLLQLRAWSESKEGLVLVYDYMSNGSLDMWLYPSPKWTDFEPLSWPIRRSILAGVAAGLQYLHEGWVQCVLHRDIKASNIMLDENFEARLGDFGLARLVDHQKVEKTTLLAGTLGYMAPEMQHTGRATKETDLFAFGILVLEVVCGRKPLNTNPDCNLGDYVLLDSVWRAHEAGNILSVADPWILKSKPDYVREQSIEYSDEYEDYGARNYLNPEDKQSLIASILKIGLLCCLPDPSERPPMRQVNQWFQDSEEGSINLPKLSSTKPEPYQVSWSKYMSSGEATPTTQSNTFTGMGSSQSSSFAQGSFQTSMSDIFKSGR